MDRLTAVLAHLGLTKDEWNSLDRKKQDLLFMKAEAEMRRAAKKNLKPKKKGV